MLAAESKPVTIPDVKLIQNTDSKISWDEIVRPVTPFMKRVSKKLEEQVNVFEPEIVNFARYALANQGKQLRPVLVALCGNATGELADNHVMVAVIIEMVHLATLVHDDVMDGASVRRNRPTVSTNWGPEISVLLGDCLFAHALKLAADFPTTEVCRSVSHSTHQVCSGEIFQTLNRGSFDLPRDEYLRVVRMKTAELFALSCELGAVQSGADDVYRQALRKFGQNFGTAYQIYDDCLDIFGEEKLAGKSLGTDLLTGKMTLPLIIAREKATEADREHLRQVIENYDASDFDEVLEFLSKHHALEESKQVIADYLSECLKSLNSLAPTGRNKSLNGLVEFLSKTSETLGRR